MSTTDSSLEEPVSRLEGSYEHLATKADVFELRADMEQRFANQTRWLVGFILTAMALMTGVAFGIARLVQ